MTKKQPILMDNRETLQRVADDIIVLLTNEPFYAYLLVKMKKIVDRRVPVAGVSVLNGESTLYINPEGYMNYTKPERLFILKHEIMHVINIHYLRRKDRDPELYNVAADVAINQLIETSYCHTPVDCLKIDSWKKDKGFVLPAKLSTDEYYTILYNRGEKLDIPQDLLNSIVGKHLSGNSCSNCEGTGSEPKPKTIKGIIDRKIIGKNQIEIKGKLINLSDDTEVIFEVDPTLTAKDLAEGQIAKIEGVTIGEIKFDAKKITISPIKGKIENIIAEHKTFTIDDLKITVKEDSILRDLEGNEITFEDIKEGDSAIIEETYTGKVKEKYSYDALSVNLIEEEEKEDENDESGDGDGESDGDGGSGSGEQKCSCCGGSGQDGEGSGSGSGSGSGLAGLHPTWDDSTDISEELAENIVRSMVQDAYNKSRGNVPGEIKQLVSEMMESKVNWRGILRNFVAKRRSTKKSPTWRKRSRRLGGLVPGNKKKRKLNLVVAIDTSGSVSDKDLALFTGEIQKIYQNGADIMVIECDAVVQNVYEYTKKIDRKGGLTFKGRGGTDFRPVFEHILDPSKTKIKPDAVIFLTDGYGPAPDKFNIPTLWCLTKGGQKPRDSHYRNEVSWGSVLTLED